MNIRSLVCGLALGISALAPLHAETAFFVDSGTLLVGFNPQLPAFLQSVTYVTGLQPGERIMGIDFRPANKKMYALGSSSRIYSINPDSGAAVVVGDGVPFEPALAGTAFGFDFNPTVDRIRIVSNTGQNMRAHPDTGKIVATDTALNYETGVAAAGIVGSAYTNSVAGATSTALYGIDALQGQLVTQAPPNDGKLNVVGKLNFLDLSELTGFDISPNSGAGYLVTRLKSTNQCVFYQIHLASGDYNPLGRLSIFEQCSGLAIQPD